MNKDSQIKKIQGEAGTIGEEGAKSIGGGAKGTGGGAKSSCVTSTPVKKLTIEQLKKELRKLNLSTTGNKADLQQRLKNYEQRMKKAISTATLRMTRLSRTPKRKIRTMKKEAKTQGESDDEDEEPIRTRKGRDR